MNRSRMIQALDNELVELDEMLERIHQEGTEYRDDVGGQAGQLS